MGKSKWDPEPEVEKVEPVDIPVSAPRDALDAPQPVVVDAAPAPTEPRLGPQGEVTAPVSERAVRDGKVRAKFKCLGVDKQEGDNGYALRFEAVTTGSRENKLFFQYTPSGQLTMGVVKEETAKMFEAGREYYLDFTPA